MDQLKVASYFVIQCEPNKRKRHPKEPFPVPQEVLMKLREHRGGSLGGLCPLGCTERQIKYGFRFKEPQNLTRVGCVDKNYLPRNAKHCQYSVSKKANLLHDAEYKIQNGPHSHLSWPGLSPQLSCPSKSASASAHLSLLLLSLRTSLTPRQMCTDLPNHASHLTQKLWLKP